MYFPIDNTKLDPIPPESPLASLGDDADFLLLAKKACDLPADVSWTELDDNIKLLLDAAENFIDDLVVLQYRPKTFILYLSPTCCNSNSIANAVDMGGRRFSGIKLPKGPTTTEDILIEFLNVDDDDFTTVTDWRLIAGNSTSPEIVFNRDVVLPQVNKPFPVQVTFETTASKENSVQTQAILTLTNYFFKNPEAMVTGGLTGLPSFFQSLITRLGGGRYA